MEKQPTLKDIAARANVSISTVSRVINGRAVKAASQEVQQRIWQIVREMDYIPNKAAQSLRKQVRRSEPTVKTIACICSRTSDFQNDPFFSEISRAIEAELLHRGYIMKLALSTYHTTSRDLDALLANESVNGVIVLGRIEQRHIQVIQKHSPLLVYTGLNPLSAMIDQVICDGYQASLLALNYLQALGFSEICYLGETQHEIRYQAYKDFMAKIGQKQVDRRWIIETEFTSMAAYENLKKALARGLRPKALFCGNDLTALGGIRALREQGLRLPQDVSLISIDDIEMGQFSTPMLTTVQVPMAKLGKLAAKRMVERIEEGDDGPMTMSISPRLIVRESTKKR